MQTLKNIAPYIVAIVFAFLFFRQCNATKQEEQSRRSVELFLNDTISYYQNELDQEVAEKRAIKGDKEALEVLVSKQVDSLQQLKRLVDEFQDVDAAGNVTTITIIDSIPIPYEVPVPMEFSRDWSKLNKHYKISGISTHEGITIDHLEIPNTLSFAIGDKKTGFFRSEYRIEAVNSNPHVKTTGLDSYTFQVPHKRLGLSLYVGGGISNNFELGGSAGIALTYTFLRF